jgi:hypothetical protein
MATSDLKPQNPDLQRRIDPATGEYRVIAPGETFKSVTEKIAGLVLTPHTPMGWFAIFSVAGIGATVLLTAVTWLFLVGVGIWGITQPVAWGFAIINFVWWIGIGHAGTLISAILLLFKQGWRNSISRFAEAMTIFAVVCAGMFPLIHVGRPWLAYWMFPLPVTMNVWPQFRSPLLWDVFAVSTYATISVVFWYIGMVPDLGTLRDRSKSKLGQYFYGIISLGWRGSVRHWMRYETAALLLSGLATPLVLSVHTVISCAARLAHYHLPALFCCRRYLLRFCHGSHAGYSAAQVLSPGAPGHRAAHRQYGQGDAGHRLHRGLRLRYGSVHGLVLGLALGSFHVLEPHVRSHGLGILGADHLQPGDSADDFVVAQAAHEYRLHVLHLHCGQHGHVV